MEHILLGKLGEDIAVRYLEQRGFKILNRNLRISHKEIDIIALKNNCYHFIEVKSGRSLKGIADPGLRLSQKKKRLLKTAVYEYSLILAKNIDISIDLIIVVIDIYKKMANISYIKSIL